MREHEPISTSVTAEPDRLAAQDDKSIADGRRGSFWWAPGVSELPPPGERALDRPDRVDALVEFLVPVLADLLRRIEGDEFTTTEFIELMQSDPASHAAYLEALLRWGEGERYAKMVVHGQVIPVAMRRTGLVEWLGFAHGADDPYAVPARWRLLGADEAETAAKNGPEST